MTGNALRKVLAVTALLVACKSDTIGPPATVASVLVSAPNSTVPITGTLQLSAVPRDAGGNPLSGRPVAWSSGDTAVARVSSGGLVTGRSLGTVTITATVEGIPGSMVITVVTGPPARLSFLVQPSSTTSGTAISPAVQVEVQDAAGNRVTVASTSITLALGANPKNGSLAGTTVQAATNGVATFSNLTIDSAATGYTVAAAATGLTGATSSAFNITVGAAAKLGFLVQPASTTGGATISPAVRVEIRDAGGNRVTAATNGVTLAIGTNPKNGTLGGTVSGAAVSGVATFNTLTIDSAGTGYTLIANATGLTAATSATFNVAVGPAASLAFLVQPTSSAGGIAIAPAVQVEVRDAGGNRVTTATTSISLAIGNNPTGGTLSGTNPVAAVNGVAAFSNLSIDKNGSGYSLVATAGGLAGATSTPFNIATGGATKLAFIVQPAGTTGGATLSPVQVEIQDAGGNRVGGANNAITLAFGANPKNGALGGTTTLAASNGQATFSDLTIDSAATGYTLAASATGLSGATSNSFDITVGVAATLAFGQQPTSTTGGTTITPPVNVRILDLGGNLTTSGANVTLAITAGSGTAGAHLSGGTNVTVAAVAGIATFGTLSIDSTGTNYTLRATSGTLTAATSGAFNITVGAAAQLAFGQQPTATSGGATITPPVTVRILDLGGNLTSSTASVTVAITSGTGTTGAHLSGGTSVTAAAVGGVATFSTLAIDSVGTGYTLTATSGTLTAATSSSFNIAVGGAAKLAFGQQPTPITGGATIAPAVTVRILDAVGNLTASTANVTLAITSGSGTTGAHLSGGASVTVAAVGGVATFGSLSIDSAGTNYTLRATSGALTAATSNTFNVAVGPAAKLGFLVQPSTTASGASITPAVQVEVRDAGGNRVTSATTNITLAIGTNPSGGVLTGTNPKAAIAGVATFSNLSIDKGGTGYTLTAAGGVLTGATSAPFNVTGGTPDHLGFFIQPSNDTAGSAISPAVQVEVLDAAGNRVTTDTRNITVAILDNPNGGTLSGTKTVAASAGVASFSNLSIDKAGTGYTLVATSSPALTSVTSADFDIAPAAPSRAHFFVEPSSATAGVAIAPDIQVEILDAFGNRVGTATNSVTVALLANPGGGILSGSKTHSASAGVATFPGLSINKAANGYTIRATSSGLASDTSVTFNITPGPATQLAFTTQPASTGAGATMAAVVVTARDAQGNTATAFAGDVAMAIGTNPASGTLSGTLSVPAVSGVATFPDLSIDKVGTGYTLTASATGLSSATSGAFNITVGAAATLAFGQQPTATTGGVAISPAMTVRILDANGNLTGSSANVTVAITSGTGTAGAHLGGTVTRAAVAGVATFNDVNVDSAGAAYTLNATSSGLTADTSTAFNVAVGTGARLDFVVQPSTTPPGGTITPAVEVEIRDSGGNLVTTDNATSVTVAIGTNPSGGTLAGTKTQTAVAGVATFSNLSINNAGNGYDLTASATSLTGATSNSFDIVVGTATKLGFFVQPSNAAGGATISPSVQVEIQDVGGNRVTTATNSVTLAIVTNPKNGHLSGTVTRAAVSGVATFNNLSIDSAATGYTLSASSSGLTAALSNAFNITIGAATKLGFKVQPVNTAGGVAITPAVQVEVRDAGGNRVTTAGNSITMAIGTNPSNGTLSGTTTLAASNGLATFSNLSIDSAGTGYRLSATASGLSSATSSTFNITVGVAAKLGFLFQPSDAAAGSSITPAVKVEIRDAGGNRVTSASNNVTVAIGTNPGGGNLGGTKTVGAVSGVATFSNLSINKVGVGYTLQATSGTLTAATSATFDIVSDGVDGTLSSLVSATDTIGQCLFSCAAGIRASTVTVTVKDQFGNLVSGAPVTLSASGTGNAFFPSGTGNTDASGVFTAAFNSSDFGAKTVSATAGGVGIVQTAAVAVMPVLVGAGDIADCNSVRDDATANQLDSIPGTVFAAGDNAYPNGRAADFTNCYDPTWGRQKARTKPVVGNHEYDSSGTAAAYFSYFTPAVADPLGNGFGYYSFDLGTWHVVVLNSDSGVTNSVAGPAQLSWLQSDLAGRSNQCVLAIWHRPLFTSGGSGGAGIRVRRLWQALEDVGAEIVINGHDHLYERFAPQDSLGNATSAGIREFVAGTGGGETHSNYVNNPANVEASDAGNFSRGVLRLTLYAKSYRWEFLPAQGQGTFTDSGTQACH
ncbi:MAG TPA: Ig-like domain-containing protein [Gemmatimonadales bacterium]